MAKVIGITGLLASGKSTLVKYILEQSYRVFDSDFEVGKLYNDSTFLNEVKNIFPKAFVNNTINKKILAEEIFSDENKKLSLEGLIHPIIEVKLNNFIKNNQNQKIIFIDVPLLFEVKWYKKCHEIILVITNEENSLKRFINRGGQPHMFNKIISNQTDLKYKIENSTHIIENNESLENFYNKIDKVLEKIKNTK